MLVHEGSLSRADADLRQHSPESLSRTEVEALALAEYVRGKSTGYWLTFRQAARALGVSGLTVPTRVPTREAGNGDLLVRQEDLLNAIMRVRRPSRT